MQYKGIIRLSSEADSLRQSYQAYVEGKLGGDWESMRDWGGKLTGAMVRIAALFHAASIQGDPTETPISYETMAAATNISEFLSAHAEVAYQMMGGDRDTENAKYILRRIVATGRNKLDRSEMKLLCRKLKADEMQSAIEILAGMRYLREEKQDIGYNGREKTLYEVNPYVLT